MSPDRKRRGFASSLFSLQAEMSSADFPTPVVQSDSSAEATPCWTRIGVFGDRSCPELPVYIHCHNCPIHAAAGLQLLNGTLPAGYRRECTEHFARPRDVHETSTSSVILFRIGTEWLGLPTRIFQEAAEPRVIHSLPHRRAKVLGLANVRGELIICVSLLHLIGIRHDPTVSPVTAEYHRLLVLELNGHRLAFPVDEVQGPHRFHAEELTILPRKSRKAVSPNSHAVLRWRERAVALLDQDSLLSAFKRNLR